MLLHPLATIAKVRYLGRSMDLYTSFTRMNARLTTEEGSSETMKTWMKMRRTMRIAKMTEKRTARTKMVKT